MSLDETLDYAWLKAPAMRDRPERLFFATWPRSAKPELARTAVTELIQGIYEQDPEMARKFARSRIFTTQSDLTPLCKGMIDVAAKRATPNATPPDLKQAIQVRAPGPQGFELIDEPFRPEELKVTRDEGLPLFARDRAVTALLVLNGRMLARARNTNAKNRTLHAELNLVRGWAESQGAIPEDAEIYVSLEPCRMCAAQIACAASDLKRLSVFFAEHDPGPAARETALKNFARKLP